MRFSLFFHVERGNSVKVPETMIAPGKRSADYWADSFHFGEGHASEGKWGGNRERRSKMLNCRGRGIVLSYVPFSRKLSR